MPKGQHLTIDFDFILDIGMRGIRRASTFLGLGVNAARDPDFKKYQLNEISLFRVMPDAVGDQKIAEFKEHFEHWIVRCALREITESFGVYLETLNKACLRMAVSKGTISAESAPKLEREFDHAGLEEKLVKLRESFGVQSNREKYFKCINQARNCITHRRGIVGVKDLSEDGQFHLSWWRMEMFIETESGKEIPFGSPPREEPIKMEEAGTVCARIIDAEKTYKKGQAVILTPSEVSEMIFLINLTISEIFRSALKYAQEIGIEFKGTKLPE
jgi:hypothetical protein